jgi:hypothetical protein
VQGVNSGFDQLADVLAGMKTRSPA